MPLSLEERMLYYPDRRPTKQLLLLYTWYSVPFTLCSCDFVQQAERGAAEKAPHGGHRGEDF